MYFSKLIIIILLLIVFVYSALSMEISDISKDTLFMMYA
jgi:hypothetical protein